MPTRVDVARARTAVDVDHSGVLLARVEAYWLHHTVVQVSLSVGCLELTARELRHVVALPWVGSGEQPCGLARLGVCKVYVARHVRLAVVVKHVCARLGNDVCVMARGCIISRMYTLAVVERRALARREVHSVEVVLYWAGLCRQDNSTLGALVEADKVEHHPLAARHLLQELAVGVIKIKVVVAVALALHEKLAAVPWQEGQLRCVVSVFIVVLMHQCAQLVTRHGVVGR